MSRRPTHIREWRKHRGLTLRDLADRINAGREAPLISYASLGRIENGQQPYSQDILEAVATALQVDEPALMLCSQPRETEQLLNVWPQLNTKERRMAIGIMQAILAAR
jgi:transcriptional regulator with XRE-family HTH domain